ncbi:SMP-30/gluconolactonase/LRE family protein [Kutzneria buriramensis]|nr:SMP-30/gluconolactonase/LRE family protein [Kutzneria buriramensis]
MTVSARAKWLAVAISCVVAGSVWVGVSQGAPTVAVGSYDTTAQLFATVAGPGSGPFGTSLEGAAFDKDGHFYFVNTTASPGEPKLMGLDLATRKVSTLYTDSTSMLNCIGFDPHGTMYLCDLKGQKVVSFDRASHALTDVLTSVGGTPFVPNDLTFDPAGTMYVTDYQDTTGRIIQVDANGAKAPVTGLNHPNGITMNGDHTALWIDEDLSGTLDHVAWQLSSPASTTLAATLHKAAYLSLGANAYADSLTVDGQGNVYMAVYGTGEVLEFNAAGVQVGKVVFPESAPKVTHVAIQPGTRKAFATASGPGGGYVFTFPALAAAPAGMPNGG